MHSTKITYMKESCSKHYTVGDLWGGEARSPRERFVGKHIQSHNTRSCSTNAVYLLFYGSNFVLWFKFQAVGVVWDNCPA